MTKLTIETLDKSRPHGSVHGEHPHNVSFTQKAIGIEAWPYDHKGRLVEVALNEKQAQVLADRRAKAKVAAEAAAEAAEKAKAEGKSSPTDDLSDDEIAREEAELVQAADNEVKEDEPVEDEVNLVLWLKGEVRYRPREIQDALKKRYGANKPRMVDAAIYLVDEQQLLPREQVSAKVLPRQSAA
jgi:hypothetical protein